MATSMSIFSRCQSYFSGLSPPHRPTNTSVADVVQYCAGGHAPQYTEWNTPWASAVVTPPQSNWPRHAQKDASSEYWHAEPSGAPGESGVPAAASSPPPELPCESAPASGASTTTGLAAVPPHARPTVTVAAPHAPRLKGTRFMSRVQ